MGFRATWGAPAGRGSPTVTIAPATTFSVGLNLNATLGGGPHTGLRWQRDGAYGLNPTPGTFVDIGGAVAAPYTVQSADRVTILQPAAGQPSVYRCTAVVAGVPTWKVEARLDP